MLGISHVASAPKSRSEPAGTSYDVAAYRRAIARVSDLAFPLADDLTRRQVPARVALTLIRVEVVEFQLCVSLWP
jgi:hypothetical protein